MSLYALSVVASSGLGPMIAGWIEANPSLQWRWIQWIHAMCIVICFHLAVPVLINLLVSAGCILSPCFWL